MSALLFAILIRLQRQPIVGYALSRQDLPGEVHRAIDNWPHRVVQSGRVGYVERKKGEYEIARKDGLWPASLRAVVPDGDISPAGRIIYDRPNYLQIKNSGRLVAVVETPATGERYVVWISPEIDGLLPFFIQQDTILVAGMRTEPAQNLKIVTDYLTTNKIQWLIGTSRGYGGIETPRAQAERARELLRDLLKKRNIPTLEVSED